jgi:hypothetical protein
MQRGRIYKLASSLLQGCSAAPLLMKFKSVVLRTKIIQMVVGVGVCEDKQCYWAVLWRVHLNASRDASKRLVAAMALCLELTRVVMDGWLTIIV